VVDLAGGCRGRSNDEEEGTTHRERFRKWNSGQRINKPLQRILLPSTSNKTNARLAQSYVSVMQNIQQHLTPLKGRA
jgi:hypothetical protein